MPFAVIQVVEKSRRLVHIIWPTRVIVGKAGLFFVLHE